MTFLVAFIVVFLVSIANGAWIFSRLERDHIELWNLMGRPTLAGSNIGSARLKFMGWVWRLKFRSVADSRLRWACGAALAMEAALLFLAFATWEAM